MYSRYPPGTKNEKPKDLATADKALKKIKAKLGKVKELSPPTRASCFEKFSVAVVLFLLSIASDAAACSIPKEYRNTNTRRYKLPMIICSSAALLF